MSTWEANEEVEEQHHDGNWAIKGKLVQIIVNHTQ